MPSSSTLSIVSITSGGMVTEEPKQPQDSAPEAMIGTSTASKTAKRSTMGSQPRVGRRSAAQTIASSMPIAPLKTKATSRGSSCRTWGRSAGLPARSLKRAPAATQRAARRTVKGVRSKRFLSDMGGALGRRGSRDTRPRI